ncbi:hypothetical protein [Candidatus Magnetominusculus dajiuhuensis]|uniref:hypothetical protein n=1 Tax=Candidatus Magnetominusculus dajiuhuensis TaxID=3137712 RepID=UPI003B4333B9
MNKVVHAAMLILLFSTVFPSWVYAQNSSFTQQDRERLTHIEQRLTNVEQRLTNVEQRLTNIEERLIRLEEGLKATNQRMDDGFNALNRRMNDLNGRMGDLFGLMYVLIGGMLTLVGFVLWDRRTTIAPVVRKNREIEERGEKMEKVLKELALKDPSVAETIKRVGL